MRKISVILLFTFIFVSLNFNNIFSNVNGEKVVKTCLSNYGCLSLTENGELYQWGQIASNSILKKAEKVTNIPKIKDIDCMNNGYLALDENGFVWIWGDNFMELNSSRPFKIEDVNNIIQISGGNNFFLALTNEKKVLSIGQNDRGQLGNGKTELSKSLKEVSNLQNIEKIEAGNSTCIAIDSNKAAWSWGENNFNQALREGDAFYTTPQKINFDGKIIDASCGEEFTIILKDDGTVYSGGINTCGQLGLGDEEIKSSISKIENLQNIVSIKSGLNHSIALSKNSKIYTWGGVGFGQLGFSQEKNQTIPIELSQGPITQISCGGNTTFLTKSTGQIFGTGDNHTYQISNLDTESFSTFVPLITSKIDSDDIKVILNTRLLKFDVNPAIVPPGRTMVPFRKIFEELNATVEWDSEKRTVKAVKGTTEIILTIDSKEALVNNTPHQLDTAPIIINSRTLVPLRFISESLGTNVDWDKDTQTVIISEK